MAWNTILFLSFIILLSLKSTLGYYVIVDAHSDECFFEKLTSGTKLLLTFEVIEGGFLDIDVTVKEFVFSSFYLLIQICSLFLDNWTGSKRNLSW